MTMPVFALLSPVAVSQPLTQSQPALTDYPDSQPQSYSEDVAMLLAAMETALAELDTEMQQLPEAVDPAVQDQVQSMLPQPLLFAHVPVTAEILPVSEIPEPEMPRLLPQLVTQELSEEEVLTPSLISTGTALTKPSEQGVLSSAVVALHPEHKVAPTQSLVLPLENSGDNSAPVVLSASQNVAEFRLQNTASLMSSLSQNLTSQSNTLSSLSSQVLSTELFSPVTATASGQQAATTLPVWQADPLPAQSQHWGQRLVQMLADKVDLQLGLNVNKAMIRLDPPSLGSIELSVQLDGDRLTVQMHSSNAQLREAMGQGLEQLRASLQQKLGTEVQIELRMGSESSSQQQQQKFAQQLTQQAEANFYAEPDMELSAARQISSQNLINQLV